MAAKKDDKKELEAVDFSGSENKEETPTVPPVVTPETEQEETPAEVETVTLTIAEKHGNTQFYDKELKLLVKSGETVTINKDDLTGALNDRIMFGFIEIVKD